MDNLLTNLLSFTSEHEKALMHGLYNAVALALLCLVFAATYCLYLILHPFLKPLIWALLCGAVLFPFKLSLSTLLKRWFCSIENSSKPLFVNLCMAPLHLVDYSANLLGDFAWKCKWRHVKLAAILLGLGGSASLAYSYCPRVIGWVAWRIVEVGGWIVGAVIASCSFGVISTILIGYILTLYVYWSPAHAVHFQLSAGVIWSIISLYISNLFGSYSVPAFCLIHFLFFIGFIYDHFFTSVPEKIVEKIIPEDVERNSKISEEKIPEKVEEIAKVSENEKVEEISEHSKIEKIPEKVERNPKISEIKDSESQKSDESLTKSEETPKSFLKKKPKLLKSLTFGENSEKWFQRRFSSTSDYVSKSNNNSKRSLFSDRNFLKKIGSELRNTLEIEDVKRNTSFYISGVSYLCGAMMFWKHRWLVPVLLVPISYYLVKMAGEWFGVWEGIRGRYEKMLDGLNSWCSERSQALLPPKVRGLYRVAKIANEKFTQILKGSIDTVSTISVICGLLVFTFCATTFITFQVYGEGLHLLQVIGQVLNTTVMNNPDIDWIPQNWEDSINNVLDDAYTHGRDFISHGMKGLTKDFEPAKAEHLEKKVLELWDRLYQAWMMSNENSDMIGPTVDANAAYSVWQSIKDNYEKLPTSFLNVTSIKTFVQENIGILTSILDSMWSILKGNASVILSIVTESMYLILMSGSLVFNFIISMVVFFSALFYLLNSSEKTYKPIELLTLYSPISCHRFAIALQEVVIGVFTVTFKLASFFGMWTWFVHNLFQVKVAYLPAVFAALLGAVPFLDPYFACLPATLELWFTRGPMIALVFFGFHFLASNIIVTDFYMEIKGAGHPYLTGLSIAGGVFCLGVEGAIFGPLLLCCIIVAIDLGRRYLNTPTAEETLHELKSQLSSSFSSK